MAELLGLSEASYSASTSTVGLLAPSMALDLSNDYGWMPKAADPNPWIEVDMLDNYTVVACYLQNSESFYLTHYNLKVSVDRISYEYIGQNISTDFPNFDYATTYWYANATIGRFWRIEPVSFVLTFYVKGDFIGYI